MACPAPWLHHTQTELPCWGWDWHGLQGEEEEGDGFERQMDEDGVVSLGEDAGSPPWGDGKDLEEGSPAEEGPWHPRQEPAEAEEELGSSSEDEGPWGAESDGEPYAELSYEGRWGSGSSPELSDASPSPTSPSRRQRGRGAAGGGGGGQGLRHRTRLPPKPGRPAQPLSPQQPPAGVRGPRDPPGVAEGSRYGQGRLNHPLPDLSKVEPRVKFSRSYRPPRGRVPPQPRAPAAPGTLRSPADIVREVLLSSGEGAAPRPPASASLPQELSSPRQATALVQQLQDDYHRLLTKYAEAENTIDQLRLGARVSLYADPPQPSRSFTVGRVGTGCPVLALSIPQARTAAVGTAPAPPSSPGAAPAPRPSEPGGSAQSPCPAPAGGGCPSCAGPCGCGGSRLTQTLAGQTHELRAQVESFEGWVRAGSPTAEEQLQRFGRLRAAQAALERAYLGARQQHPPASGRFDPHRTLEGDIFCLGLRLEELKERLEPGARQQFPPQPPCPPPQPPCSPQPCCPPAPHPESPVLTEGPRGPAGDGGAVTGRFPRPLWHKRLQVEENFGDLLEQYRHVKSLPERLRLERLSLEQLSLADSASPEELDGPAAGDGGPGEVPCRALSLQEGASPEMSPRPPPQRRAKPLPPGKPLRAGGTRGHEPPTTTEEAMATAQLPPGLPTAPSGHSSAGGGTTASHQPHMEQRIVSPETDSGFVGSEGSRVSPSGHPLGHRAPHSGTPVPAPLCALWDRDVTPLRRETRLMGTYPTGRQGDTGQPPRPPSTPSQSCCPPCWAESGGSEAGPGAAGAHTDSEAEGGSCTSTSGQPPTAQGPASPSPSSETPAPGPPAPGPAPRDLLGVRRRRDRAVRELRDEVWRLRRRLQEGLRRPHGPPRGTAPPGAAGTSPPARQPSPPARGRAAPGPAAGSGRSASLPRDGPGLHLGTRHQAGTQHEMGQWHQAGTRHQAGTQHGVGQWHQAGTRHQAGTQHEVGQWHQAGTPRPSPAPRGAPGSTDWPQYHGSRTPAGGCRAATGQPQHSTPRGTRCPACRASTGAPAPGDGAGAVHAERVPGAVSPRGSRCAPRAQKLQQPGLWYLVANPGAIGCLTPVPLVPYVPSLLCCSPAVPTSAPAMPGVSPQHSSGQGRAQQRPRAPTAAPSRGPQLEMELQELQELEQGLGRALEAAQGLRQHTECLSRALAMQLGQARALRGSSLC
ncbi:microtubule organization protein AKNA isoform X3 [Colius striatus]|uniref:microtubule organization protein AKNA isoform X3 n=1 Tax=Colius striatus TaxID=57412 RepID=UPI002B1E2267|nr:microtubule organization protein AKNA isoform X3 [Colius striatus]